MTKQQEGEKTYALAVEGAISITDLIEPGTQKFSGQKSMIFSHGKTVKMASISNVFSQFDEKFGLKSLAIFFSRTMSEGSSWHR